MEVVLRNSQDEMESSFVDTESTYKCVESVGDKTSLWCDRVCVHEKVDMESAFWGYMPQTILELVFARLPLHQIFQLRTLSKEWRAALVSPSFQIVLDSIQSRRLAFIGGMVRKRCWSFGTSERKWCSLPLDFLPMHCDFPVAADGGLLCCRRSARRYSFKRVSVDALDEMSLPTFSLRRVVKPDLQLYVCNPLTRAWRRLPLPSQVQELHCVHLVTDRQTKQYTITIVNDLELGARSTEAIVEVYDSATNMWTDSNGRFHYTRNTVIYYKNYVNHSFLGVRAYDITTGRSCIPFELPDHIFFSESSGCFPLAEYQGLIYVLHTQADKQGIWVLQGPSQGWKMICNVPKVEVLKFYSFYLYVSADVIFILGVAEVDEPERPYVWMLDRVQGKWTDMVDHKLDSGSLSQVMLEMRLDGTP